VGVNPCEIRGRTQALRVCVKVMLFAHQAIFIEEDVLFTMPEAVANQDRCA
jgi:hypothetical protein